ncbi:uncharacterized protein BX663DRAFT_555517 [Cokeromyces recurvatus]|uniref:uncharacterized protein n=1 Tax=Cokeromyces recurvatus TaxID=90255 RepID=UPI0022207E10|nr:uncharacterized protein BX663DRAFT_555517 [Cokeromyces recurvatus]KAI7898796.1 hypothetical protein BX663DRAFT_555517 [Cokeromyces recurvatus]
MQSMRRPIKATLDSKSRWHEKFKRECANQVKLARQEKLTRLEKIRFVDAKILKDEWIRFKQENEQSMREEGIVDIDSLIEESIREYEENEAYFQQEQEELENTLASYEASRNTTICVNCQKSSLVPDARTIGQNPIASCPNCGFYVTESCLYDILTATSVHSSNCTGMISYSLEAGTDNTIIGVCNICDLWNLFYM